MLRIQHAPRLALSCLFTKVDVVLADSFLFIVSAARVAVAAGVAVAVGVVVCAAASTAVLSAASSSSASRAFAVLDVE